MDWELLTSVLTDNLPDRDTRRAIYEQYIQDGAYDMNEEDIEEACEIDSVFEGVVMGLLDNDEEYDED